MKPIEQLYFQTMPPPEVLMKLCSEEPEQLMDVPMMSICGESLNETGGYKMAILSGLVGTALIGASRVSTRFPTARKVAIIAGITINTIAVMYAIYNCKLHWNDKEGGKQKLNKVQSLISKLLSVCKKKFFRYNLRKINKLYSIKEEIWLRSTSTRKTEEKRCFLQNKDDVNDVQAKISPYDLQKDFCMEK